MEKDEIVKIIRQELFNNSLAKHHAVRQEVFRKIEERVNKKIEDAIETLMNKERMGRLIDRAVERVLSEHYKLNRYPFKNELENKLKEAASRVVFDVVICPPKEQKGGTE